MSARIDPTQITPALLKLMPPEDRARYEMPQSGVATAAVAMLTSDAGSPSKADVKAEKALQQEFEDWLNQHDYIYRREPMHQATMAPAGHPDFTVTLAEGRVAYFEYKTAVGKLSPDQVTWHKRAQERRVPVFVTRSLQFSIDCLRQVEKQLWT